MTQSTDSGQAANYYDTQQTFEYANPSASTVPAQARVGQEGQSEPKVMPQQQRGYGYGYGPGQAPPPHGDASELPGDSKHTFTQAFNIQKPKVNDLWAGILVSFYFFRLTSKAMN
jgi:hypothetical protein